MPLFVRMLVFALVQPCQSQWPLRWQEISPQRKIIWQIMPSLSSLRHMCFPMSLSKCNWYLALINQCPFPFKLCYRINPGKDESIIFQPLSPLSSFLDLRHNVPKRHESRVIYKHFSQHNLVVLCVTVMVPLFTSSSLSLTRRAMCFVCGLYLWILTNDNGPILLLEWHLW